MATLFFLLLSLNSAWAQNQTGEDEFQQKKQFMNSRFDDFFNRQQEIQKNNELREKSAGEMAPVRTADEKAKEKARQDYIRTKPKPMDREPDRLVHEREQANMSKQMNEHRKSYVQRQEALMKMFSNSRKVPAEYDSGLKDPAASN